MNQLTTKFGATTGGSGTRRKPSELNGPLARFLLRLDSYRTLIYHLIRASMASYSCSLVIRNGFSTG
jgi:hypothetical protein